jgi:hypothetical protein
MAFTQVTSGLIASVANTSITGLITSAQIANITNSQITGTIGSSQLTPTAVVSGVYGGASTIPVVNINAQGQIVGASNVTISVANTQITGVLANTQGGTGNANLTFPSTTSSIGYLNIPQNSQSTSYTTVLADAGTQIYHPSTDANARTFTIAANSSVPYIVGTVIQFVNMSTNALTIAINSDTLYQTPSGSTGSRTLAQYGVANAVKLTNTTWLISGSGLT